MSDILAVISNTVGQLFDFTLPIGLTFGAVVVGVFGMPLVVKAIKKFF